MTNHTSKQHATGTERTAPLLLGFTPDSQMTYTIARRGYPDAEYGGFHPVCSECDGYCTVYPTAAAIDSPDPLPWPDCPRCAGRGWAPFSIILDAQNPPSMWRWS
jgi:hypothetical protein